MNSDAERTRWDARFEAEGYHFGTEPNAFLASQAHRLQPDMTALCVADGEGRNGVWLAARGLHVTAFDLSRLGVEKAKRLAAMKGTQLTHVVADINAWDWDAARYDVVVVIFAQFMSLPERARFFSGLVRTLAPGGLLLMQGYPPRQIAYGTGGPKQPEQCYTADLLRDSFAELEILHLSEHESIMDEGHGHQGMSALVDLVARKPLS